MGATDANSAAASSCATMPESPSAKDTAGYEAAICKRIAALARPISGSRSRSSGP
jgi:hypothetical protein